ncbi:MAG: hypothetical protein ACR2RA_13810 [Geminicoccaceae bacterium]
MLATTLSLVLCLAAAPALALSTDAAEVAGTRLVGQQAAPAIEEELTGYLDDDDIAGAQAFVADLVEQEKIGEAERRALEDRIWRTKTERTLEYAKKIREAIRDSDLDAMRDYNARMQRLTRTQRTPDQADLPEEEQAEDAVAEAEEDDAAVAEDEAVVEEDDAVVAEDEVVAEEDEIVEEDAVAPDVDDDAEVIADLLQRGEAAIGRYNLSVARPGIDSALGMVGELMALGGEGEAAAAGLGRKVMAVYKALIERDINRGRLDKAATFAARMAEVAERAGLPRDEADALAAEIGGVSTGRREHDRLMQQAAELRDQGKLVAPEGDHALAAVSEALRLGADPEAASTLLDDIIKRQRARADGMVEDSRFRDAAMELNRLGDALLAANVGETTLVADLRAKASALYRRADLQDKEQERAATVTETPAGPEGAEEADENGSPFTFINPF